MSEDFFTEPDEAPKPVDEPAKVDDQEPARDVDRSTVKRRVAGVQVDPETKEPVE